MAKKHVEFDPVKKVEDTAAQSVIWSTASLNAAVEAKKKGLPLKANPFLNNDIQLLKPDLVFRRTEEEIEDWIHCSEDSVFFANKCYLKTPDGVQQVTMRDYQEEYLHICDEFNFSILLSCRQAGKSVTNLIDILHTLLFNNDINGALLSKSGQAGIDMLDKLKQVYRYLPWHLKAGINVWNVHQVSFDNNSTITTESFGPTACLGKTINYLILDEFAWMPANDVDMFYQNVIPTLTTDPDSKVRICSTQNGFNKFYKLWQGAIKGENEYHPFKVDWPQVPEWSPKDKKWVKRDEKWKRTMIRKLGSEEEFEYQYGTTFSSSDFCLASRECLTRLHNREVLFKNLSEDDKERIILPEKLKNAIFLRPDIDINYLKSHWFVVLKDLAEGCKGDYTVFHIFEMILNDNNTLTFDEAGYWRANDIELEEAALSAWVICQQLFTPERYIVSVELNTYGILFEKYLMDLNEPDNHPEWAWRFNAGQELDFAVLVQYKKGKEDEDLPGVKQSFNAKTIPGIRWNSSNKPTNCQLLKSLIEKDIVRLYDISAIAELEAFEDKTGKGHYKASYGHDDIIMTCVQIPKLLETARIKSIMEEMRVFKPNEQSQEDQGSIYDTSFSSFIQPGSSADIMNRLIQSGVTSDEISQIF